MYKVSVITPCYNIFNHYSKKHNLFEKNINSIQKQTMGYENIEHILIDNGSVDNTKNYLKEIAEKFSNVKLLFIDENTGGPSAPRNLGIDNSTGEFLLFLDDDDYLEFDALEIMYNEINKENVDILCSNYYSFDGDNILKHKNLNSTKKLYYHDSPDFIDCMTSLPLFNRNFIIENNIRYPNSLAEDSKFNLEALIKTDKPIVVLNDYYCKTYIADNLNSLSHQFNVKQITDYVEVYSWCIEECLNREISFEYVKSLHYSTVTLLIGNFLRSDETLNNQKEMINLIRKYLLEYKKIPLNLPILWKIFYYMFIYDLKYALIISSKFCVTFFESKWFKRLFRNKNYGNKN